MKSLAAFVLFSAVVCAAFGSPATIEANVDNNVAVSVQLPSGSTDVFSNMRKLIEELVANLRKAAQQAADAMAAFSSGIHDQVKLCREKLEAELAKLRQKVSDAISSISNKITNAGTAVKECLQSSKDKANILFNEAIQNTMTCADEKVKEVGSLLEKQVNLSKGGLDFANKAMVEMRNCTEKNSGNIFGAGACLGTVALKTEMKGAVFLTQSGISIARIDMALAGLPVGLDMCAGSSLVKAGMGTAKIIMEIGGCSAGSLFGSLTGTKFPGDA